jgi:hypothetical protein
MNKVINYNKLKLDDIKYDNKTKLLMYNNSNLLITCNNMLLKLNDGLYNFILNETKFIEFVYGFDKYFINKLYVKNHNIENDFITSLRHSIFDEERFYLKVKYNDNVVFYDENRNVFDKSTIKENVEYTIKPVFNLSLQNNGYFKWIEWELIQLIIFNVDEDDEKETIPNECLIDVSDDENLF